MQTIKINATMSIRRDEVLNNNHLAAVRAGVPTTITTRIETVSGKSYKLEDPYDEAASRILSAPTDRV